MTKYKRVMVTMRPEWEPELDRLKKDQFYNVTRAEMYRQLIQRGLESVRAETGHPGGSQRESA